MPNAFQLIDLCNRQRRIRELMEAMKELKIKSLAEAKSEAARLEKEIKVAERTVLGKSPYKPDPSRREDSSIAINLQR